MHHFNARSEILNLKRTLYFRLERGLGKTRRTPYQLEDYTKAGAVTGTLFGIGAGVLLGAGAAGAGEVVGGLVAGSLILGKRMH